MLKNEKLLITIFIPILSWLVLPSLSFGETKVGGPIFADTTWTLAGSPYIVVMNAGVEKDITLTIEPGVTVKFDGTFFLEVSGTLIARGTAANPITFTSNKPEKKPGDWQGIKFLANSIGANLDDQGNYLGGSILEYCNIKYGENAISYSGVFVSGFVNHCTITNNSGTAISASYSPQMLINNSIINNNSKAIEISGTGPVTITNSAISNNSGETIISISGSWGGEPTVTIENNEIIGNSYYKIYKVWEPARAIYLRDCNPNVRKNKIMNNSTTKKGVCIYIDSCKSAAISHNIISQNSDGDKYGAIYAYYSTVNIDHNLIKGNTGGIRAQQWGTISVTHNTITNNSGSGVYLDEYWSKATISNCNIHDNTDYDVYNNGSYSIQATNNWWGTEDPLIISKHIYDYFDKPRKGKVIFNPYLTAPVPDAGPSEEKPPCLKIITDSPSQPAGVPFIVSVQVGDEEHPVSDLFSISFKLNYSNTEIIDVEAPAAENIEVGDLLSEDAVFSSNVDDTKGQISIDASKEAGIDGYGVVAKIKLISTPDITEDTIVEWTLSDATAQDANGSPIQLAVEKAQVTITKAEIPTGISVWPGDTDNNGIVDGRDVLPVGMYWKKTGAARSPASTTWEAQQATPWMPQEAAYADADGNGIIDGRDILPIGANWKKTHPGGTPVAPCFANIYDTRIDHAKYLSAYQMMLKVLEENPIGKDAIDLKQVLKELIALAAKPIPLENRLEQNFPNPFNPETWIPYQLAQDADVVIELYDVSGRLVRTLSLGRKEAGMYLTKDAAAHWDGRNSAGEKASSGIFFYRIKAGAFSALRKMVIIK